MLKLRIFGLFLIGALCVGLAGGGDVAMAQDDPDDDFIKEWREKKRREKAIAEGKDPDAIEPKVAAKPKLPPTASGWMATIKQKWDSKKEDELKLVDEAVEKLKAAIGDSSDFRDKVRKSFDGYKETKAQRALATALIRAKVSVESLRAVLKKKRPIAMRAIMNPAYTEADGCKLQPDVDRACAPLFAVWNDPVGYAIEKMGMDLAGPAAKLDRLASKIGEIVPELAEWPDSAKNAIEYMRANSEKVLNVKAKAYKAHRNTLTYNAKLKGGRVTEEDRKHIAVLNDYRMMLGKGTVKLQLQLCNATTRHSEHLKKIGRIGHNINGHPDGRTPGDRAKRAGYAGGVSENVLVGATTGAEAVWQWYRAAEHHRNMIGNHSLLGVGHAGNYWTQNFAGGRRR